MAKERTVEERGEGGGKKIAFTYGSIYHPPGAQGGKGGRKRGPSPSLGKSGEKITKRAQTQKGEREKRVMNN